MRKDTSDEFGFRFRQWNIYKDARQFRKMVNETFKQLPATEKYLLSDQSKRALNSIILQIAEGANRNSDKDSRMYINRAHTSLDEIVSCCDCALDDGYISESEHNHIMTKAGSLAKRLRRFSDYLLKSYYNKMKT